MPTQSRVIDLGEYRSQGDRVFTGRGYGLDLRKTLNLDDEDKKRDQPVTIKVPQDVLSLNSSFILGLFGDSIRALGEAFEQKYLFDCSDRIRKNIQTSKRRALLTTNIIKHIIQ